MGDHETYFIEKHYPFPLEVDFDAGDVAEQAGFGVVVVDFDDLSVEEEADALLGPAGEFAVAEVPLGFGGVAFEFADPLAEGVDVAQEVARFLGVTGKLGLDEAMEQQVAVAADGGGEVAVVAEAQPEVPDVVRRVARLPQGADDHRIHFALQPHPFGLGLNGADQRGAVVVLLDVEADGGQLGKQCFDLLKLRRLMDPEDPVPVPLEALGGGLVGQKHALFDEGVGGGAGFGLGGAEELGIVEGEFDLFAAEVEAPLETFCTQCLGELLQWQEPGKDAEDRRIVPAVSVREYPIHCVVVEAKFRVDDRFEKGLFDWFEGGWVEGDFGHKCQPINPGFEGADVFAQFPGEHRERFVRQVGGKPPLHRLPVDGAEKRHIVAHVRNGDVEGVGLGVEVDRIVEVFGGHRINGAKIQIAQIDPVGVFGGGDVRFDRACLLDALGWESITSVVERQRNPLIHER